jgi:SAM-dependent methyltransferase
LETYFEWTLGIATTRTISREALGYQCSEYGYYGPSPYGNIRRILRALDLQAGRDVFLDFGSGKGRAVIAAGLHPFKRIIGVELSPVLHDIACRNLQRARKRLMCQHIEIVRSDAAEYQVPDDATVVYFANPFGVETLGAVLDNIQASLTRAPRSLSVISYGAYPNPFELTIRACPWLRLREHVTLQRTTYAWIYENTVSSGAA